MYIPNKTKLIVLGSSASAPFPRTVTNRFQDYLDIEHYKKNFPLHDDPLCLKAKEGGKDHRLRSSLALVLEDKFLLFDAGPDIRYQLERAGLGTPSAIFITHDHWDACFGIKHFSYVPVYQETARTLTVGKSIEHRGARVTPFRVLHAHDVPSVGFRVQCGGKTFAYFTDIGSLEGVREYIADCDFIFADGSCLHRDYPSHLSMMSQLRIYKEWGIHKVYFTHIGHSTLPHDKLGQALRGFYPQTEVAYDNLEVNL